MINDGMLWFSSQYYLKRYLIIIGGKSKNTVIYFDFVLNKWDIIKIRLPNMIRNHSIDK